MKKWEDITEEIAAAVFRIEEFYPLIFRLMLFQNTRRHVWEDLTLRQKFGTDWKTSNFDLKFVRPFKLLSCNYNWFVANKCVWEGRDHIAHYGALHTNKRYYYYY